MFTPELGFSVLFEGLGRRDSWGSSAALRTAGLRLLPPRPPNVDRELSARQQWRSADLKAS